MPESVFMKLGMYIYIMTSEPGLVNFCWSSSAQPFLVSGPLGAHDHIFVLSLLLYIFKLGLFFDQKRNLTNTGHTHYNEE
jgi:hypothetical protein